ncbi:PEP/pyruvate-binding domain-containing protein [Kribbella sp. NPDC003557]|uniref:PEP/pyruvate-binding domain-containing protein n=1 Tax=Kribbella sp. NPDC003557 TaxID=3154449 RepID=UPI0033A1111F
MLVPLAAAMVEECGAKAATLGTLIRSGFPVPEGVVVPFGERFGRDLPEELVPELARWLDGAGGAPVAVRSSAANEDTPLASAAGQHDSFLGVQGFAAVMDAVRACQASVWSARATAYRGGAEAPAMAVIVQRHLDADVAGVMFTRADGSTLIESSWGLGPSVVEGRVTPDSYQVAADGAVTRTIADKRVSLDRNGPSLVVRQVAPAQRRTATLTDATARQLATLARTVAELLGAPQDIEWALTEGTPWLLQSRPITAEPPTPTTHEAPLMGIPGSHGTATGPARIVRGPADFPNVHPGDILICPHTDPAWTPLLSIAAGVVTETGGTLSHAAIVAREHQIPAVLALQAATRAIPNGARITINGTTGVVHL